MEFVKFTKEHIKEAIEICKINYLEESKYVLLPSDYKLLELEYFADNELGVAAVDDGKLIGFIGVCNPFSGAFDTYDSLGVFSPLHANGAIGDNRGRLYQDMIEYGFKLWSSKNILGMGISLYAHNNEVKYALFEYGFGMRCKDRISLLSKKEYNSDFEYAELDVKDFPLIRNMRYELDQHLKESPCFLQGTNAEFNEWIKRVEAGDRRTFVAKKNGEIIAYLDISDEGENFVTINPLMANINGAYCKQEYRGLGVSQSLLNYVGNILLAEGYKYLGVDHESYNPSANRYWNKNFDEYTNSLVKRIEIWSLKNE